MNYTQRIARVGDSIEVRIYGRIVTVKILAIHDHGTLDVERADGRCFRVTGLAGETCSAAK